MAETRLQKKWNLGAAGKLREFCSETTAHGFGRLASASSAIERLIWVVCLLAALTYTFFQGFRLVSEYFSYPVDVKVTMKRAEGLEFPAIVVCNMNAVRKQALKEEVMVGKITVSIYFNNSLGRHKLTPLSFQCLAERCMTNAVLLVGDEDLDQVLKDNLVSLFVYA